MKILQVTSTFPPAYSYGGPVEKVYQISYGLVKRNHEVTVVTTDVLDSKNRYKFTHNPIVLDGIKVFHFKNVSNKLAHKNIHFAPTMAIELKKQIKACDVVHIHEYRTFSGILASYFAHKYEVPIIIQPNGSIPWIGKYNAKIVFDKILGSHIINGASKIIASSYFESDYFGKIFPSLSNSNIIHIPNGINLDEYNNLPEKGEFKKKYNIAQNEKVILFLSRIHPQKGADLLLYAFAQLHKINKNIKLVIAGPDEGYLNELMKIAETLQISKSVIFPGPLYGEKKIEAFIDAHVFVLPSPYDSFGNVVIEALACGTPVIFTNKCGVSEYIWRDYCFIIDYDITQLYLSLWEIINDETIHKKMTAEAKKLIHHFDMKDIILQYEKVYEICKKRAL
jgi:glycosyltransferase involved in cell wall biosynthesis